MSIFSPVWNLFRLSQVRFGDQSSPHQCDVKLWIHYPNVSPAAFNLSGHSGLLLPRAFFNDIGCYVSRTPPSAFNLQSTTCRDRIYLRHEFPLNRYPGVKISFPLCLLVTVPHCNHVLDINGQFRFCNIIYTSIIIVDFILYHKNTIIALYKKSLKIYCCQMIFIFLNFARYKRFPETRKVWSSPVAWMVVKAYIPSMPRAGRQNEQKDNQQPAPGECETVRTFWAVDGVKR